VAPEDRFDHIVLFSDHGLQLPEEGHLPRPFLLDESRTRVVLCLRSRGDRTLERDPTLRSLLDVLPTLADDMGLDHPDPASLEGSSLRSPPAGRPLLLEDQSVFTPSLEAQLDCWGVRTEKLLYLTDLDDTFLFSVGSPQGAVALPLEAHRARIEEFDTILRTRSAGFEAAIAGREALARYRRSQEKYRLQEHCYTDGTARSAPEVPLTERVLRRLKHKLRPKK
jgi:hypothetical protein